jgi:transcriptional regulator with XRE-family HTH domain
MGTGTAVNQLGRQLRRLRREAGQTLEQLAAGSAVSKSMISKIERGESQPTTPVLGRLAEALHVGISDLVGPFPGERPVKGKAAVVIRAARQPAFRDAGTGFVRRSLSPPRAGGRVDIARNELPPRGQSGVFVAHDGTVEEHVIVIRGSLTVLLDGAAHELEQGDVLWFRAGVSHRFVNRGRGRCEYIIVIDRGRGG